MAWSGDKRPVQRHRARDRHRRRHLVHKVFLFLLCAGLVTAVWYGTRLKFFTITTVDVSGGMTIDLHAVEQKAQAALNGSYFFLIPRRFAYTYPHDAIEQVIERIPRVAHATVTRTSRAMLSVTLEEYTPYALWCAGQDASSAPCLFISEGGFAFAEAPSLQGAAFLRYMTEGRAPQVGTSLASSEDIQAAKEFARALEEKHGMHVYAIVETSDADVRYQISGGGELLVAKGADLQKVFENVDTVLNAPEFKHIKSGNFVYIDLRFGNKVFVKE